MNGRMRGVRVILVISSCNEYDEIRVREFVDGGLRGGERGVERGGGRGE